MSDDAVNSRVPEWAYRIIIGFIQGDHDQIDSIFHEVYNDAEDTGQISMDLTKYLAANAGHLFVQRNGGDPDAAIKELQQFLSDIALEN